jgi:PAS domain S-box-containing protein
VPDSADVRGADAERRDNVAEGRDDDADKRDGVAHIRDVDGEQRDADAEQRDGVADKRDVEGGHRDAEAGLRDDVADERDLTGDRRDDEGDRRDHAAEERDDAAGLRDAEAERRDDAADKRDRTARLGEDTTQAHAADATVYDHSALDALRVLAAADRREAAADRRLAATERGGAALDRATALADRVAGAARRGSSGLDRGIALADRGTALADRVAGASRRGSSGLDRGTALADRVAGAGSRGLSGEDRFTAFDDRVASALDRRSAAEYLALERRMAESEARAWRLLQAVPDPVVVADARGIIELVNVQAVALFGYQPDELIGQPVERLIPVGLHDAHRAHRTAYVAAEHATPMSTGPNIVAVCKDGTTVPVEVNLSAITLATGRAVLASIRDVSDRKLADAELRISDERFRVSFDSAPIGMALLDLRREAAGRFLRVNAAFCELTGYCEADVLATDSAAITHPGDRDETVTNLSQLVNGTATRWDTDKRYRNASGVDVWVHSAVSVVHDAGGTPSYGVMQVEDITDRKRAEAQVEERFRELATNVGVGFVLRQIDPPEYLYFNPAYLTVFGFDPAGPPPTPAESLAQIHPEDMERVAAILGGAAQGERIEQEWRFIRPDGEVRWVSGRVSPITDRDGVVRRLAGLFEDITDRRAADDAVLAARAEAERANAAKDEFLSRMSHELRTPLNAVLGFAQLLELDPLDPSQDDSVGHILQGGRHLLTMIDDLLDIAGIEADRLELSLEPVAIAELVQDALGLMRPLAVSKRITLGFDRTQPAAGLCVRADRRRLKQILLNLLSNAIKYNYPGGTVDVALTVDGTNQLRIAVIDHGMGIAPEDLHRLFTPFDRLGRQSSNIEGTGIGLALSQRLTTIMGGRLSVESSPGTGSTFVVTMPVTAPLTVLDLSAEDATAPLVERTSVSRLLYIEDNTSNVELLASVLRRRPNWVMSHTSTGSAGLELASTLPVVILLDLHLPDTDGIDVLRALKADPATADIPVAVLSADASPGQIDRLLAAGAELYLTKPLHLVDVFAFLDAHAV